jgi:hypothetical protein
VPAISDTESPISSIESGRDRDCRVIAQGDSEANSNALRGSQCGIDGVAALEYANFARLLKAAGIVVYRHDNRWMAVQARGLE